MTRDGGATWRPIPKDATLVDAFPPGALAPRALPIDIAWMTVLDPHADRFLKLRNQPPVRGVLESSRSDPGVLWALGTSAASLDTPHTEVANSPDGGRTWQVATVLPTTAEQISWVAVDRRRAYVLAFWEGRWHLHHTTDGGHVWSKRELRFPGAPPIQPRLVLATDNRMMIAEAPGSDPAPLTALWISDDGGATLRPTRPTLSISDQLTYRTAGDLLWVRDNEGVLMTEDGETWYRTHQPSF